MNLAICTTKKYNVKTDFGWYKNETFALFNLQLFELCSQGFTIIFCLKIAKFIIGLFLDKEK